MYQVRIASFDAKTHDRVSFEEMLIMPANVSHAVKVVERFKTLFIMIKY